MDGILANRKSVGKTPFGKISAGTKSCQTNSLGQIPSRQNCVRQDASNQIQASGKGEAITADESIGTYAATNDVFLLACNSAVSLFLNLI